MALSYTTLEGKSTGFKLMIGVLTSLSIMGFASFLIMYFQGHQVFGSNNAVPWGAPIIMVIFLIGLSAGLHILAFFMYILNQDKYKSVIRLAVFMAIVLIFGAQICIFMDLGRPEKFWRLFMLVYMNNMTSMFAINAIFYSSYLASAVIYLIALLSNMQRFSKVMGMVAFTWAMLTHGGTGAIFGFIATRETWYSGLSPFEFIMAALTSSLALLILLLVLLSKCMGRSIGKDLIHPLQAVVKGFLLAMLLLMVIGELTHIYAPHREPMMYMLTGPYSWLFWVGLMFMGVLVPLVILFHPRLKKNVGWITLASALVVIGIFVKRLYLVVPGAAYPQHYYPGEIEGVWGGVASYSFAPVEIMLSVGIVAFLGLFYVIGLKYLPLLPEAESSESDPVTDIVLESASAAPEGLSEVQPSEA